MTGKVVDYGKGWARVHSEGRNFYIATDTENIRQGQELEFDPEDKKNVVEVRK